MVRYNHAHNRVVFDSYNFSSKDMEFLMSVNYRYMACDPDTKNSAYAIVDAEGKLIDAWVVKAADLEECAMQHSLHLPEVEEDVEYKTFVESQQFYNGDDPKKVKNLLVLARTCGISMMYVSLHYSQPTLILPRKWSKSRQKKSNQYWMITKMGYTPVEAAGYCYAEELLTLFPKTHQKHLWDAICIAQYGREQHQEKLKLESFKQRNS